MPIPQFYVAAFCMIGIVREMMGAMDKGPTGFFLEVIGCAVGYSALIYLLHVGGFW